MKISFIIATYNREAILCSTLENVIAHVNTYRQNHKDSFIEIILVDQTEHHSKETEEVLYSYKEKVTIIKITKANLPNARNVGIKNSNGDIIIFIDDDVLLADNYLETIVEEYKNPTIDSVVGRIILKNVSGENVLLNNSSSFKENIRSILMFCLGGKKASMILPFGLVLSDFEKRTSDFCDGGRGCNMSFRKEIFNDVGYFDHNYIGNSMREETDLFCRLKAKNKKIKYCHKMELIHLMENTGGCRNNNDEITYWNMYFKNQIYFYYKNFKFRKIYIKILLILDILKCRQKGIDVKSIFNSNYERALSIVNAKRSFE